MALKELDRPLRRAVGLADPDRDAKAWPYRIPAVRTLLDAGLDFGRATVLVGENGSGKSTIVEALAEAYGLNPEGGSTGARFSTRRTESSLANDLLLTRGAGAARGGYFLRAETMHGLFSYLEQHPGGPEPAFHARSHGEAFQDILTNRLLFRGRPRPGLYLMDEPESALSFTSSLKVLAFLVDMVAEPGVQLIVATHSPVLSALPGATILQLSDAGIERRDWADLDLVVNERYFLGDPQRFLRHLDVQEPKRKKEA